MGQLRAQAAVFLSAGVPDPAARHFLGEGDSVAISAAVAAVLEVTLGRRRLVWGGHPAITPMVWAFAESMGVDYAEWVLLYQSLRFEDEFPQETALFHNVVFTERVGDEVEPSLALMRNRMLGENEFESAVFIGGMQGIIDEHRLFAELAPNARIVPVVSTGGAARLLGEMLGADPALAAELDYVRLMYERLVVDPNERRYATPSDQPADVGARIEVPHGPRG
jgi:hypothetical protein